MASIRLFKKDDPTKGYLADLGVGSDGKRDRRLFKTLAEAEKTVAEHTKEPVPTGVLFEHRLEFLHCYQRLKEIGSSIQEATDFFINHGARKGNPAVGSLLSMMLDDKERLGGKPNYIANLSKTLQKFVIYAGAETEIGSITISKIEGFVYTNYKNAAPITKVNVIRNIGVLFGYAKKKKFIKLNPVDDIERPKVKNAKPKVMTPDDFEKLLNHCVKKEWNDRMIVFVLVGFCGIRAEEASQLNWKDINFDGKKVTVPHEIAKTGRWRTNIIPENAMAWLHLAKDDRKTGPIIGNTWQTQLVSAVKSAKVQFSRNCIRHSFCSYALEGGWKLDDVIKYMGHNGGKNMIDLHYRNVVEEEAALNWWKIVPSKDVELKK